MAGKEEKITSLMGDTGEEEFLQQVYEGEPEEGTENKTDRDAETAQEPDKEEPLTSPKDDDVKGGELEPDAKKTEAEESVKTSETDGEPEEIPDKYKEFDDLLKAGKDEKKPPQGYVPHQAFHQEREKRKALQAELDNFKKKFEDSQKQEPESDLDAEEQEKDRKITAIEEKQERFEQWQAEQDEKSVNSKRQEFERLIDNDISTVDKALKEEGYPGFETFSTKVSTRILELGNNDPEILAKLQNPEGWKYVYKKHIFPELKGIFLRQDKEEMVSDKKVLKQQANLIGSPGKGQKEVKEEDSWSLDDYEKHMNATSLLVS